MLTVNDCGRPVSIFENPSNKEIAEACGNSEHKCRFMIDVRNRKLYVWDYSFLHEEANEVFKSKGISSHYQSYDNEFIWGIAKFNAGKLRLSFAYLHDLNSEQLEELLANIGFIKRWFVKNDYEHYFKDKFRSYGYE